MKESFIWEDIARATYPVEEETIQPVGRRQFLQTVGLASIGLTLSTSEVFARTAVVSRDAERWRELVMSFVDAILSDRKARVINAKLSKSKLYNAPKSSSLHGGFRAPYVFSVRISHEIVICSNRFEVNQFPFYASGCPCGRKTDLNEWEIRRIIKASEIKEYGCVVVPITDRRSLERRDHANYRKVIKKHGLSLNKVESKYTRLFHSVRKNRSVRGYGIVHKTGAKELLLDSDDF